jgi:hypothetical protein
MARQPDDLSLGTGLIRKGEARGLNPAMAGPAARQDVAGMSTPSPAPVPVSGLTIEEDDPPLRATPPDDVPKRFTSFRLPVALDEELRAMMFETRRSKQDLLIEFVTEGIKVWRRERAKRS